MQLQARHFTERVNVPNIGNHRRLYLPLKGKELAAQERGCICSPGRIRCTAQLQNKEIHQNKRNVSRNVRYQFIPPKGFLQSSAVENVSSTFFHDVGQPRVHCGQRSFASLEGSELTLTVRATCCMAHRQHTQESWRLHTANVYLRPSWWTIPPPAVCHWEGSVKNWGTLLTETKSILS